MPHTSVAMRRLAAVVLGLVACRDASAPRPVAGAPDDGPARAIADAPNGGRAGFYFLAPIAPSLPSFPGSFDPDVVATARICARPVAACPAPIAQWTVGGAPGSALTVDPVRQAYVATWAVPANLTLGTGNYRLEVRGAGTSLGFVDLNVVASTEGVRGTPRGFWGVVRGGAAPIRFRIERGMVGAVEVSPASAIVALGGTQPFTARVTDLHGMPIAAPIVAWSSSDPGVLALDPLAGATTIGTGVAVGPAVVVATSNGVSASAAVTVDVPR